jgi:hypothetical protein
MRVGLVALVAAVLVSACSPNAGPTPGSSGAGSSPSASRPDTSLPSASNSGDASALDVHLIPQDWTTPLLGTSTDGTEIVWSKGGDSAHGAPDLYRYVPGDSGPTLIYRGADRMAQLMPIAVRHGKYAFEETYGREDGSAGWRLWYIAAAGRAPVLLDSNSDDPHGLAAPPVWIALTDARLVWSAIHQTASGPHYYLRSYEIGTGAARNLADADATRTEYWFPNADDSGRLVYGTVEYKAPSATADRPAFHVYFAEIGAGPLLPTRLDTDGNSAEPVLSGDTVIWKSVTGDNVVNRGSLTRYSLSTRTTAQVFIGGQAEVNDATAGNRFVAAWLPDDTIFELYDLQTNASFAIEKHDPTSPLGVVRPVVAADMVVFTRVNNEPGANLQLCWAHLPASS